MSGGAWEYVMGRRGTYDTDNSTIPAAFYEITDNEKYYRIDYGDDINYCIGGTCLGEALNETHGWYNDRAAFVAASYPWFTRGGYHNSGAGAGAFHFSYDPAGGGDLFSFRVVLVARTA